ncbi:hypothetical protein V8C43DRAFT_275078 [Trichoderma afarasin]
MRLHNDHGPFGAIFGFVLLLMPNLIGPSQIAGASHQPPATYGLGSKQTIASHPNNDKGFVSPGQHRALCA